jgi:hypothetical protein
VRFIASPVAFTLALAVPLFFAESHLLNEAVAKAKFPLNQCQMTFLRYTKR